MTTAYWRAMKRVNRRARAYTARPTATNRALLRDACRLASMLAMLTPDPRWGRYGARYAETIERAPWLAT